MDLPVDKVDYYMVCANIGILATQSLFVMEVSPYTVKITSITILYELFENRFIGLDIFVFHENHAWLVPWICPWTNWILKWFVQTSVS